MSVCLNEYYTADQPFLGRQGDFITAPEISSLFGMVVGQWVLQSWRAVGEPPLRILELGPGDGRLAIDVLHFLSKHIDFKNACYRLYDLSDRALGPIRKVFPKLKIERVKNLNEWSNKPVFVIANEFFDALPIRQFEFHQNIWRERWVGLDDQDRFCFVHHAAPALPPTALDQPQEGNILEYSPQAVSVADVIFDHLKNSGGSALFIDYGYEACPRKSTLRGIQDHQFVDFFKDVGQVDLSSDVDFGLLNDLAQRQNLQSHLSTQGQFLKSYIKNIPQNKKLLEAFDRLVNDQEMGSLFKVLECHAKN